MKWDSRTVQTFGFKCSALSCESDRQAVFPSWNVASYIPLDELVFQAPACVTDQVLLKEFSVSTNVIKLDPIELANR